MREGNLRVSCARVALAALEEETGSVTTADLEHMMGLVVNYHDDACTLIRAHGSPAQRALIEDLILEDWANDARANAEVVARPLGHLDGDPVLGDGGLGDHARARGTAPRRE
jgi:hypothetical protein